MNFCITLKSVRGSTVSTITGIYAQRSEVQILDAAIQLSLHSNIHASYCAQTTSNSTNTRAISQAVMWSGHTVWPHASIYSQDQVAVELYLHSKCLPPWHILGQLHCTLTYLFTY